MISITKTFEFAAAHFLPHHKGLCKNLHGHSYKLEITVTGETQKTWPEQGMIMDFSNLKAIVKKTLSRFDHSNLNEYSENPTAENVIEDIAIRLDFALCNIGDVELIKVRLWETSTSYATWRTE